MKSRTLRLAFGIRQHLTNTPKYFSTTWTATGFFRMKSIISAVFLATSTMVGSGYAQTGPEACVPIEDSLQRLRCFDSHFASASGDSAQIDTITAYEELMQLARKVTVSDILLRDYRLKNCVFYQYQVSGPYAGEMNISIEYFNLQRVEPNSNQKHYGAPAVKMILDRGKDAVFLKKRFAAEPLTLAYLEKVIGWAMLQERSGSNTQFDEFREDRQVSFVHTFPLDQDKILAAFKTFVSSCQQ